MSFNSMFFLLFFLPISAGIYHLSKNEYKPYVLVVISLLFYAFGSIQYLPLFVINIAVTIMIGRLMYISTGKTIRTILLVIGCVVNVSILGYYKYFDAMIPMINMFGLSIKAKHMALPLGISFFTFKAISYLADIYTGKSLLRRNPVSDVLYLSMFTQIQSGPLTRYDDIKVQKQWGNKGFFKSMYADGVFRFLIGFNKKVLLANVLANITTEVFSASSSQYSTAFVWLGAISFSLQLFFDFAGYSDMAIGLSEIFGYPCSENFNYPYMTESIAKFWRRWHISLSQWFRDYIYIPLGGSRVSSFKIYRNLLIVWLLTGIWHGSTWNFIVWGLGYFVMIAFERATGFPEKFKTKIGKFLYRLFAILFIIMEWVIFKADNLSTALIMIKSMFYAPGNSLADMRTMFLIKDYLAFLIVGILLCFPIVPGILAKLKNHSVLYMIFEAIVVMVVICLFVCSLSFVIAGQNNPFMYANF